MVVKEQIFHLRDVEMRCFQLSPLRHWWHWQPRIQSLTIWMGGVGFASYTYYFIGFSRLFLLVTGRDMQRRRFSRESLPVLEPMKTRTGILRKSPCHILPCASSFLNRIWWGNFYLLGINHEPMEFSVLQTSQCLEFFEYLGFCSHQNNLLTL